jgi:hypothetical protein
VDNKVHIISMSFGLDDQNDTIDNAIARASRAGILIFGAASNNESNIARSYPGRNNKVICIHACDGRGFTGIVNPSPRQNAHNFTTLGVGIRSKWKNQEVFKSGTSFATIVAAGIAASILEFANLKCKLSDKEMVILYGRSGMVAIFNAMSEERDGYDYVQPADLFWRREDNEVAEMIQTIIKPIAEGWAILECQ